jgi:hypothetical protein
VRGRGLTSGTESLSAASGTPLAGDWGRAMVFAEHA